MDVGVENRDHRVFGDGRNFFEQHVADLHAGARVDHDHAFFGQHEAGVVHEPLVGLGRQLVRPVDHVHPLGEFRDRKIGLDGRRLAVAGAEKHGRKQQGENGNKAHGEDPQAEVLKV